MAIAVTLFKHPQVHESDGYVTQRLSQNLQGLLHAFDRTVAVQMQRRTLKRLGLGAAVLVGFIPRFRMLPLSVRFSL